MKLLVILSIALVLSGADAAGFLDTIKSTLSSITSTFKQSWNTISGPLGQAMTALLNQAKVVGTSLLQTGAKNLLGLLGGGTTTPTRDVAILDKVEQFLQKGEGMIGSLSQVIGNLFHGAMSKFRDIVAKIENMQILGEPLSKFISSIDEIVMSHNLVQGSIIKTLIEKPAELLIDAAQHLMGHKRSGILDTLASIGATIANLFKPISGLVTQHVGSIGSTLKNVGTALFGALTGKLSTHISTLKTLGSTLLTHGKNALSALLDATTDIMNQTLHNITPTIQKVVETAKDAGNVLAAGR